MARRPHFVAHFGDRRRGARSSTPPLRRRSLIRCRQTDVQNPMWPLSFWKDARRPYRPRRRKQAGRRAQQAPRRRSTLAFVKFLSRLLTASPILDSTDPAHVLIGIFAGRQPKAFGHFWPQRTSPLKKDRPTGRKQRSCSQELGSNDFLR